MSSSSPSYPIVMPAISSSGVYFFTTGTGVNYEVRFGRRQNNVLNAIIVFGVTNEEYEGEEYSLTNKGELYRVMGTIVKIVKIFMDEHPNMLCYEFTGLAKESEGPEKLSSRVNLYRRYLPQIFGQEWVFVFEGNKIIVNKIK